MKRLYWWLCSLFIVSFYFCASLYAQLPDCNHFYYPGFPAIIYQYNIATNTSSVNSIPMPALWAGSLAVSHNLNAPSPAVTFYTTLDSTFWYHNGATWVNTGHSKGSMYASNICGAGPYIYNLDAVFNKVYRYDGTGPAVLVLTLPPTWGGPFDCVGDAAGNFYLLNTNTPPYTLTMYSPAGVQMCVYNLVGFPTAADGGGFAIINNVLYADIGGVDCFGTITGNTITYAGPLTLSSPPIDFASCELTSLTVSIATPGSLSCATPTTILNASTTLLGTTWSWAGPGIVSGGSTSSPTVNMPGTYTVTVTGSGGCTTTATATCVVTQTSGITLNAAITNTLCNGTSTGAIDITPSAGVAPYTYLWSTGGTVEDLSGVAAGTYTVTVTDNNGCSGSAAYTVAQPAPIALTTNITSALCGAATGSASVTATGGTGAYTYSWAPSGGSAANAPALTAGNYTVTVTDANLCTQTATVTVNSTSAVTVTNTLLTGVTCLGGADGSASVIGGGGVTPYTYVWSSGATTNTATNLAAGNYTVVVTDNTGCSTSATYTIGPGAPLPVIDLQGDVLSGCVTHCVNFSIPAAIPTGALQSYQWLVAGVGAGNLSTMNHCFTVAGLYDVALTVTDTLGCTNTITKPAYISVQDIPVADFITDKASYLQSEANVHITDQSTNATHLFWDFNDGATATDLTDFYHQYADTGTFCIELIASASLGCADTVKHCIIIQGNSHYYIPNSFTPNGDGLNDVFYPVASSIKGYSMEIYDRWGERIFTSAKDDDVWDGHVKGTSTMAPQGVYVYKIIIKDAQGITHEFMGHLNLIR